MFNKKEKDMEKTKIDIIKKVMMLDSKLEVETVLKNVSDAMAREFDLEDKEEQEFKKWKAKKNSDKSWKDEVVDEITF
jgi:hypothetical protein